MNMSHYQTEIPKNILRECRSVFIAEYNNLTDTILSQNDFGLLLRSTGRNPSLKEINNYWHQCELHDFDFFCRICMKILPISKEQLLKAFRKLDVNNDGFLTSDELVKILSTKGERMTPDEAKAMLISVDKNNDGKVDYSEFCSMMSHTSAECIKWKLKKSEQKKVNPPKPAPRSLSSSTATLNEPSSHSLSDNSSQWQHMHWKGCFHLDSQKVLYCHQYSLRVSKATKLRISVKPYVIKSQKPNLVKNPIDITVFIFNVTEDGKVKKSNFVLFSNIFDAKKNAYLVETKLESGSYLIMPATTGIRFGEKSTVSKTRNDFTIDLIEKTNSHQNKQTMLSKRCKAALKEIFDIFDLDGNGLLSKKEFEMFTTYTEDDDDLDEESWNNLDLVNDQLPLTVFLNLHEQLFAQADSDVVSDGSGQFDSEVNELQETLEQVGFNQELILVNAFPFLIDLHVEKPNCAHFDVLGLLQLETYLELAFSQIALRNSTPCQLESQITFFIYQNDYLGLVVVRNGSSERQNVKINANASVNAEGSKEKQVHLPRKSTILAATFVKKDAAENWKLQCKVSIVDK